MKPFALVAAWWNSRRTRPTVPGTGVPIWPRALEDAAHVDAVLESQRLDLGVSLTTAEIQRRAANLERRLLAAHAACTASRLRELYQDAPGHWEVDHVRRYQGDAGVFRPAHGWRPPRLDFGPEPKPVLRWRWA